MELLFQALDEIDDLLAAVRQVLVRYLGAEIAVLALGVSRVQRAGRAAALTHRRDTRIRPA